MEQNKKTFGAALTCVASPSEAFGPDASSETIGLGLSSGQPLQQLEDGLREVFVFLFWFVWSLCFLGFSFFFGFSLFGFEGFSFSFVF